MPMRHIFICVLSGSTVFFHIIKVTIFGKTSSTKYVFWLSFQIYLQYFPLYELSKTLEMSLCLHVKYFLFLFDFNGTLISSIDF